MFLYWGPFYFPLKSTILSRTDNSEDTSSTMGITQAIISVFLVDDDKIRCINAGNTRITFFLRPPLYYVCVSSWGEPESVVSRFHLCSDAMIGR